VSYYCSDVNGGEVNTPRVMDANLLMLCRVYLAGSEAFPRRFLDHHDDPAIIA
jgi:hypothetical protein